MTVREIIKHEYFKANYLLRTKRISKETYDKMIDDINNYAYNINEIQKRRRRRKTIRDNIIHKKLDWYVTFTLNKELHGVPDDKIKTNITQLLRYYGIQYVLIPEHTKKDIIHFHGFIDIRDFNLIRRKIIDNQEITDKFGNEVYEFIPLEKNYGFTQLINITNKDEWQKNKMINYITKYLEKEGNKTMSSRLTKEPYNLAIHFFGDEVVKKV